MTVEAGLQHAKAGAAVRSGLQLLVDLIHQAVELLDDREVPTQDVLAKLSAQLLVPTAPYFGVAVDGRAEREQG